MYFCCDSNVSLAVLKKFFKSLSSSGFLNPAVNLLTIAEGISFSEKSDAISIAVLNTAIAPSPYLPISSF